MDKLILYVLLTLTPGAHGNCGIELRAPSYRPARIEASQLRLDGFGSLLTTKDIQFPVPKEDWGIVQGFCIVDDEGRVLNGGTLERSWRISAGDKAFYLNFKVPPDGVDLMKRRMNTGAWWMQK